MNDPFNGREYEPQQRKGLVVVAVALAVLAVGAVVMVLVLGGSGSSEQGDSAPIAGDKASPSSDEDPEEAGNPAVSNEGEEEGEEAGNDQAGQNTEEAGGESSGDGGASGESSGDDSAGDDSSGSGGDEARATDVANDGGDGSSEDSSEGSSGSGSGRRDGGGENQPGSYDPLGTDAKPGDLTPTDRDRAELVVSEFVSAAYGYAGEDATTYSRGIDEQVLRPDFYSSPAGEELAGEVEDFDEDYEKRKATLDRFEITSTEPDRVVGTAYYESGPVDGSQSKYLQQVTLVPEGAVYEVRSASKPQEVG